jgi:hypothetical protein
VPLGADYEPGGAAPADMAARLAQPEGYSPWHNDVVPGILRYIKVPKSLRVLSQPGRA